jgi:hypothetical protein
VELNCEGNNIACFPPFPNSLQKIDLLYNPFNCLPNYVLPAMNTYTSTPLCAPGNSNGCGIAGINDRSSDSGLFVIYPNPIKDKFEIITISTEDYSVGLFDLNGNLVFSKSSIGKCTVDLTDFPNGTYIVSIKTKTNLFYKKLIYLK